MPAVDAGVLRDQVIEPQGWPVEPARPPRGAATRLRAFVGWHLARGSTIAFVDGPMATILAAIAAPALLGRLLQRQRRVAKPPDL